MTNLEIFLTGLWGMRLGLLPFILMFVFTGLYEAIDNKWQTKEKG